MTDAGLDSSALARVRRVAWKFSLTDTVDAAADVALAELAATAGAEVAALWVLDRQGALGCRGTWRSSDAYEPFDAWCRRTRLVAGRPPVGLVLETRTAHWTTDPAEADPERVRAFASCGLVSTLVVPLLCGDAAVGALELATRNDRRPPPPAIETVEIVAALLGQFVGRLAARAALDEAEKLRQAMLDAAFDAFVAIDSDGRITVFSPSAERMFGYSRDEAIGQPVSRLLIPPPFRPFHEEAMARYRTTGELRVVGRRRRLAAIRRDGTQFPIELMIVYVALEDGAGFAAYVHDLTAKADIEEALVRSGQRFAEQGRALQRSLLPPSIPSIDGLDLVVRYTPAGEDVEVCGDFYDVFPAAGGGWALAVGDVEGKGIEAATMMSLARFTLRGIATKGADLPAVFSALNDILTAQQPSRLCTLAYGRLVATDPGFRLTLGLAGHPAPLHASGDGIRAVGQWGRVLGAGLTPKVSEETVELTPGDVLLVYTDGLTEARSPGGKFLGEQPVREALGRWRHLDAASIATKLERLALSFQNHNPRDDIALVVLKVPAGGAS